LIKPLARPIIVALCAALVQTLAASGVAMASTIPTATRFDGIPTAGAVFHSSVTSPHSCSGSVVASPRRNLILTAAHCIRGAGTDVKFVPMYHDGLTPFGVWTASATYVDARWISKQDPHFDYAFLTVAPIVWHGKLANIQDVVGANKLVVDRGFGLQVRVIGYPHGINDKPITCANRTYDQQGYPGFDCHGYVGGTSGGPFLLPDGAGSDVNGVIGGLHQGGCFEFTSYTSYFDADTTRLYGQASSGAPRSVLPAPGPSGC
jgi:V8-like Glu-specific endopeptidase